MSEYLDPQLAQALEHPAQLVRTDPTAVETVHRAGRPAQQQLQTQSTSAGAAEDRYSSAALLATAFGERGPLHQAAQTQGSALPPELLSLAQIAALRPELKEALSRPILTGLLEWATQPDGAPVPLELAMAARDLQMDNHAVFRSVAGRAEQLAQAAPTRERGPLERLAEILRTAADPTHVTAEPAAPNSPSVVAEPREPSPVGDDPTAPSSQDLPTDFHVPDDLSALPGSGEPVPDSLYGAGARGGAASSSRPEPEHYEPQPFDARTGQPRGSETGTGQPGDAPMGPPAEPLPPREPSTNELFYGAGSDRYAQYDPATEQGQAAEKNMARNWGIVFAVIVVLIIMLVILL